MAKYNWKKNIICIGSVAGIATSPLTIYHGFNYFTKKNNEVPNDSTSYFHDIGVLQSANIYVSSLFQDKAGNMWIGTVDNGLYKYDTNNVLTNISINDRNDYTITRIFQDKTGNIWVGSRMNGLYKQPIGSNIFSLIGEKENLEDITAIYQDKVGTLWLGTYIHGLWISKDDGNTLQKVDSIEQDNIDAASIMQDKEGNIWVGTMTAGLWKSPDTINFTQIVNSDQGLQSINNIMQDDKGNIWLATADSGLWKSEDGKTFDLIIDDPDGDSLINNIIQDKDGNIWVGSKYGLSKSIDYHTFEPVTLGKADVLVSSLFLDENNNIWVGTKGDGLMNNVNPFNFQYSEGAKSTTKWIDNKKYYLSNKSIDLIIEPVDEIDINGSIEPQTTTVTTLNLKKEDSPFNISIKKWGHTYSFNVAIFDTINIPDSNFKTNSPSILTQYEGYLFGDENKPENVKSVVSSTGEGNLDITKFDINMFVDYSNSYYTELDSGFKPRGTKINLNPDGTKIIATNKTFYLLHIQDYMGDLKEFYLQIGGTVNSIPIEATTDSGIHTSGNTKKDVNIYGTKYDYITNEKATFYNNDPEITKIIINQEKYTENLTRIFSLVNIPAINGIYKIQTFVNNDPVVNQTINVLVRSEININPRTAFSNNQGLTVNKYPGYVDLNGEYTKENILSVLDSKTTKATNLSLHLNNSALDTTKNSYYQRLNSSFNPIGHKKIITSEIQSISQNGNYKMTLTDLIGNTNIYYVQIGGPTNVFPTIVKLDKPLKAEGRLKGYQNNATFIPKLIEGLEISMKFKNGLNGELSNGDIITLTYKLKDGYEWNDKTMDSISLNYKVENLQINAKKGIPTWEIIAIISGVLTGIILIGASVIIYRKFHS